MNNRVIFSFALKITGIFILTSSFYTLIYFVQSIYMKEGLSPIFSIGLKSLFYVLTFWVLTFKTEFVLTKIYDSTSDEMSILDAKDELSATNINDGKSTLNAKQIIQLTLLICGIVILLRGTLNLLSHIEVQLTISYGFRNSIDWIGLAVGSIAPAAKLLIGAILIRNRKKISQRFE